MPAQIHDKLLRVGKRGTKTTLANPGKPVGATSLTIDNPNNWEYSAYSAKLRTAKKRKDLIPYGKAY